MVDQQRNPGTSVNHSSTLPARLRQARLAAGLTQDEVVESLARPITKQALSKFERGKARPSPPVLLALASALGVKPSWLLSEPATTIAWAGYRKHARLSKTDQTMVEAQVTLRTEAEVRLRSLFNLADGDELPRHEANTPAKAEDAAAELREHWRLGTDPIASLVEVVESRGGIIVTIHGVADFDGISGFTAEGLPVIAIAGDAPVDRLRFSLAHELGHLVLGCDSCSGREQEDLANRFAGALLAPGDEVKHVLGERRRRIELEELALIKRQWGISMQAAVRRAHDLGIIRESAYQSLNIEFRKSGRHRDEGVECPFEEQPMLLDALALRAFAEELMSARELRDLLAHGAGPAASAWYGERPSIRELARMTPAERRRVLAATEMVSEDADAWDATDAAELRRLDA